MQHIETVTVGSGGAASIEFSAISGDFTDLCLVFSLRSNRSALGDYVALAFNGSTAGFTSRILYGYGTGVTTNTTLDRYAVIPSATNTSNTFGNGQLYIPNYAGSANKSFSTDSVYEGNSEGGGIINAGLWSNTAAITSIELSPAIGSTFNEFGSASLYGITAGSDGIVAVS